MKKFDFTTTILLSIILVLFFLLEESHRNFDKAIDLAWECIDLLNK